MRFESRKIPNNLILFWHDKESIPAKIGQAVEQTIAANADSKIIFADDNYMYHFIQSNYGNEVLGLFKSNRIPASRSDMARLMLLYEYGGVYLDASMETSRSVTTIVDDDADLVFVRRDDFPQYADCPKKAHVINGILGAVAKCELIKEAIHIVMDNLRTRKYDHVWYATGAHNLNILLEKYERRYQIATLYFSLLKDDLFVNRHVPGVSNAWVHEQRHGILAEQ